MKIKPSIGERVIEREADFHRSGTVINHDPEFPLQVQVRWDDSDVSPRHSSWVEFSCLKRLVKRVDLSHNLKSCRDSITSLNTRINREAHEFRARVEWVESEYKLIISALEKQGVVLRQTVDDLNKSEGLRKELIHINSGLNTELEKVITENNLLRKMHK